MHRHISELGELGEGSNGYRQVHFVIPRSTHCPTCHHHMGYTNQIQVTYADNSVLTCLLKATQTSDKLFARGQMRHLKQEAEKTFGFLSRWADGTSPTGLVRAALFWTGLHRRVGNQAVAASQHNSYLEDGNILNCPKVLLGALPPHTHIEHHGSPSEKSLFCMGDTSSTVIVTWQPRADPASMGLWNTQGRAWEKNHRIIES